jgi:hypothetical protein
MPLVEEHCYEYDALSFCRVPGHLAHTGYLLIFNLVKGKEAARRDPALEAAS